MFDEHQKQQIEEMLEDMLRQKSSRLTYQSDILPKTIKKRHLEDTIMTGTAGTAGDLVLWDASGNLVDGPTPPSGTIVGTTDTQTLTNKTLTSPVINFGDSAPSINPVFNARLSGNQENLTDSTWTTVTLNAEEFDVGGDFDAAGSNDFTVPVTGYYLLTSNVTFETTSVIADKRYASRLYKNGTTEIANTFIHSSIASTISCQISNIVKLTATDTIVLQAIASAGVGTVDILAGRQYTYFSGHLLSV